MRPSPLQKVKKNFESRAQLVSHLIPLVDRQRGDTSDEQVKTRLTGISNLGLLRLHQVEQRVRERFGSRDKLIEYIVAARKKAGFTADSNFEQKLSLATKARLLDMARQKFREAPQKQSAEEKLKKKRGRKTRERALAKANA